MKKIISLLTSMVIFLCSVCVDAAGGGVNIGDDSPEILFTGSASSHYLLLSSNGVVSAWGDNTYGQCGAEPCENLTEINYIDFDNKVVKVVAGNGFSIALDENNTAWGFGNNAKFQLGISRPTGSGTPTSFSEPVEIAENIIDIVVGDNFTILLKNNGEMLFSGMGNAHTLEVISTGIDSPVKSIYANNDSFVAVTESNKVYYQKSDNVFRTVIEFGENIEVQSVSLGMEHLIFICKNGDNIEFYTYGENNKSQLGVSNVAASDTPVLVFNIPYDANKIVRVFSGEYNTTVEIYTNLSASDTVTQYQWGTDAVSFENGNQTIIKNTFEIPESSSKSYQLIDIGRNCGIGFDFVNNVVITYNDEEVDFKPIIESVDSNEPMYNYQYSNLEPQKYNVNFVKLNEDKFTDENKIFDDVTGDYIDKYDHWEFVNEHQFKVKVKSFNTGLGFASYNPAISTITLSKDVTGENRIIGTYGPSIWNFNRGRELFKTEMRELEHGNEDGTEFIVSAFTNNQNNDLPLNIPIDVDVYYENPGEITENTKFGLYLYGVPDGTTARISEISGNTFKVTLSGNSTSDLDYDCELKLCYIRTENGADAETIDDIDLNIVSVLASEKILSGFAIKSTENTPEVLTLSGTLTKGKENGKIISASLSGGNFSKNLSTDCWSIIGVDGVVVSYIERVDDNHVNLILSGNSDDKYTNAELKVICGSTEYADSRIYDNTTGTYTNDDLTSDNFVLVERQYSGGGGSGVSNVTTPKANVSSGEVAKGTIVELSSSNSNAKIYYTTDGTTPTADSKLYSSPITIDTDTTIKFITVVGNRKSSVQSVTYTVKNVLIKLKANADQIKYIISDGNLFYPDEDMSRYEILEALNNLFDIENMNIQSDFTDVGDEYNDLVNLFVGADIIEGYPDKTFRGNNGITRAEFVKILNDMLGYNYNGETADYTDIAGHWCENYIASFSKSGILKGYPDGSFKPDNIISKAETITILNRVANIKPLNTDNQFFEDVTEKHWACNEIYAACEQKK